jgi:uncharacterized protein (TIGR02145 family)
MQKSKILIILLFIAGLTTTCQKDFDNPYDRDCPPELWTSTNFEAIFLFDSIQLIWDNLEDHFDGYQIELSSDSVIWVNLNTQLIPSNQTTFTDTLQYPGKTIQYRIFGIADKNQSNYCFSNKISTAANLPDVVTGKIELISETSVELHGSIKSDGGAPISKRGFYFNTVKDDPLSGNEIQLNTNELSFSHTLENLEVGRTYYATAYAENETGGGLGEEIAFTTQGEILSCNNLETFTDSRDGNEYQMVQIGNQVWMTRNLAWLPSVSPSSSGSYSDPLYYVYDYQGRNISEAKSTENYATYGVLYNWPAAIDACPSGWHLPTDEEWMQLERYIGMSQSDVQESGWRGTNEGEKLRTSFGWDWDYEVSGTNDYCFSALPGGVRSLSGYFVFVNTQGFWWSATERNSSYPWGRMLFSDNLGINKFGSGKKVSGYSVRCIKDTESNSNGLVAYYPFNGNANDESGNDHHGSSASQTDFSGTDRFGNPNGAMYSGNRTSYITIPHSSQLDLQSHSIAAWVKTDGYVSGGGVFGNGYNIDHYALCVSETYLNTWINYPKSPNDYRSYITSIFEDREYHHVVATYDLNSRKIWIDGALVDEMAFSEAIDYSTPEDCYIGMNFPGGDEWFYGFIDEIQVYNRALSDREINLLYNNK